MNFIANETEQKLRGGYYTPPDLARFCSAWALEGGAAAILEPSCGDGAFIESLAPKRWPSGLHLTAFELSEEEAVKARERAMLKGARNGAAAIIQGDFLEWAIKHMLRRQEAADAVVGNPPFIRYQYLPPLFQRRSEQVFEILRLPFTKHTNAWVPFVLACIALLKAGGRLAMVIPSEIVHVMHAAPLRAFLARQCDRIGIIDPTEIWFADTLQGAVVMLAEKAANSDRPEGLMSIIPVSGREFLNLPAERLLQKASWNRAAEIDGKWTLAAMPPLARSVFDQAKSNGSVSRLREVADVDVGIVTGANKFFLVADEVVEANGLAPWAHPMFGRSEHCPGIIYDERQHRENALLGHPTNFLWFNAPGARPLHRKAVEYVKSGEAEKLHLRYKCRIREPWHHVPSVYSTSLGMLKRSHDAPRLIHNAADAFTTDTSYRLKARCHPPETLAACFLTALTALSSEVEGRYYGGGVLELVPSEIERLLICVPKKFKTNIAALDSAVRKGGIVLAIEQQTARVLGAAGFSPGGQSILLDAWHQLRRRRQRIEAASEESACKT